MLSDVNRDPRRWVDESGRVRVIEGWHPSAPTQVGYNVMVDGDWLGAFGTLDSAATAAAAHVETGADTLALRPHRVPAGPGGKLRGVGLRLVRSAPDDV